jgi:ArsR family transcriptional regulator
MRDRLESDKCSQYLKAVADPERLKIIQCLQAGSQTVGVIARQVGTNVANVSHHLKQLRFAGLVASTKRGRFVEYALAADFLRDGTDTSPAALDFGCCRLELGSKLSRPHRQRSNDR